MAQLLVLGAINVDEVYSVQRHPDLGETVVAGSRHLFPGGKAANQAAAAAEADVEGVSVHLIGAVGDDEAGAVQLRDLAEARVDVSRVRRVVGCDTGRAVITVSADGENTIVLTPGANAFVSPGTVNGAVVPDVVVGQTEVGAAPVDALAQLAARSGARVIVNNAPTVVLAEATLRACDPLVVNTGEARSMLTHLLGQAPDSRLPVVDLAATLRTASQARSVVVTAGADGCVLSDDRGVRELAAAVVDRVVDTTGAGDAFVGTLAAALGGGHTVNDAIARALVAAAAVVQRPGARPGLDGPMAVR